MNEETTTADDESRRTILKALGAGTMLTAGAGEVTAQQDGSGSRVFVTSVLSGENQQPDPVDTDGIGAAVFRLGSDGTELHYALVVAAIDNVTQAHIHVGGADENGPVVAFLFGAQNEEGAFTGALDNGVTENGILATGTVTADDLVGPLEGASLDELVQRMRQEAAYVNVHTTQNPAGEIRAQIAPSGDEAEVELETQVRIRATSGAMNVTERAVLEVGGTVVGTGPATSGRDGDDRGGDDDGGRGRDDGDDDGGDGGDGGNGGGDGSGTSTATSTPSG